MTYEEQRSTAACLCCGSTEFIWGKLIDPSSGRRIDFRPDGPFFTVVSTNEAVKARKCVDCGNIQYFAEPQLGQ